MSKRRREMRLCPENCIYRNRWARFCGYCLIEILADKGRKEEKDGSEQGEVEDTESAERSGL